MTDFIIRDEFDLDIARERLRQDEKWGQQNHHPILWAAVLQEEAGEFTKAALHYTFGGADAAGLRAEAVQVAAVAKAIIECCDRNGWYEGDPDERTFPDAMEHYREAIYPVAPIPATEGGSEE